MKDKAKEEKPLHVPWLMERILLRESLRLFTNSV